MSSFPISLVGLAGQYDAAQLWFRAGAAIVGLGLLVAGLILLIHKAKDRPATAFEKTLACTFGMILILAGVALPVFMWLSMGTL